MKITNSNTTTMSTSKKEKDKVSNGLSNEESLNEPENGEEEELIVEENDEEDEEDDEEDEKDEEEKTSSSRSVKSYIVKHISRILKQSCVGVNSGNTKIRLAKGVPQMIGEIIVAIDHLILMVALFHMFQKKKNAKILDGVFGGGFVDSTSSTKHSSSSSSLVNGKEKIEIPFNLVVKALTYFDEILDVFRFSYNNQLVVPLKATNQRSFDSEVDISNESLFIHYFLKSKAQTSVSKACMDELFPTVSQKQHQTSSNGSSSSTNNQKKSDLKKLLFHPVQYTAFSALNGILYDIVDSSPKTARKGKKRVHS